MYWQLTSEPHLLQWKHELCLQAFDLLSAEQQLLGCLVHRCGAVAASCCLHGLQWHKLARLRECTSM